jgi:hypothetical protein
VTLFRTEFQVPQLLRQAIGGSTRCETGLLKPLVPHKGVITPPPTGDEEIHIHPHAGHDEEVIPPPGTTGEDPSVEPR